MPISKSDLNKILEDITGCQDKKKTEALTYDIFLKYLEDGRHYHNLNHIDQCMDVFDALDNLVEHIGIDIPEIDALGCAVWFHDVVYVPGSKDNERLSANMAEACILDLVPDEEGRAALEDQNNLIRRCILASRHDRTPSDIYEAYMIDIDLSILGTDYREFLMYNEAIKKEYKHVPEQDYIAGRTAILQGFLNRDHIYYTPFFRRAFETKARENLQLAIKALQH
ncbi:MAG: N-methyl-D-aspartate receptor NMDAR2C subunit [Dehalococcoidia bacterium]|nr:MAG: N-methyl-D-aspartate receptor NMDAR2C subunit [Dehalococcoidia bacterium]